MNPSGAVPGQASAAAPATGPGAAGSGAAPLLTVDQRLTQLEQWVGQLWCCCCWCQKEIAKLNGTGRVGSIVVVAFVVSQIYHALSSGFAHSLSNVRTTYFSASNGAGASRAFAFAGPGEITHSDGFGGSTATYSGAVHQSYSSESDGFGGSTATYSGVTHGSSFAVSGGSGGSVATYSGPVAQTYPSAGVNGSGVSVATYSQP